MSAVPRPIAATGVGGALLQALSVRLAEVETYRGFEEIVSSEPARLVITTAQLGGRSTRLARPIQVELRGTPGGWVAENTTLELFGDGASPQDAMRTFVERFEHFLSYYTQLSWDEVGGNGLRLKKHYENIAGRNAGPHR